MARSNPKAAFVPAVLICLALTLSALQAADTDASPIAFDVPPQPLKSGLVMLAEQAHIQLVVSPSLLENLSGVQIRGSLTARAAFTRLLTQSGLTFDFIDPNTVVVRKEELNKTTKKTQ
jgi:hypothetical protein